MKRNLIRCISWLILFSICLLAGCNSPTNEGPALTLTPDLKATPSQTVSGGNVNAGEPTPEPIKEVLEVVKFKEYYGYGGINPAMYKYIEDYPANSKTEALDIPVYDYNSMFFLSYEDFGRDQLEDNWIICLGTDRTYTNIEQSIGTRSLAALLTRLPHGAIRLMPENDIGYVMYDTDKGVRLYFFFDIYEGKANQSSCITAYAALMSEKLSYSDYKGIKKGDELRSLASIDPAMEAYADYFYGPFTYSFTDTIKSMLDFRKEKGLPLSTVSILSDGALKIGLDYINGKFVVDTIEFSENFTLECYGGEICYRIAPVDYVE